MSSPFDEYISLKNVIAKKGHSGCVIFLVVPKFANPISDMLNDSFRPHVIMIINNDTRLETFKMDKDLTVKRVYIIIPYENVTFIKTAIPDIQKIRSNKAIVLLPQNVFEEISSTPQNPLSKILNDYESYVSIIVNIMSEKSNERYCLNNSLSFVISAIRKAKQIQNWCQKSFQKCLSQPSLFSHKMKLVFFLIF